MVKKSAYRGLGLNQCFPREFPLDTPLHWVGGGVLYTPPPWKKGDTVRDAQSAVEVKNDPHQSVLEKLYVTPRCHLVILWKLI